AVPEQAQPREQAVIFADVGRQFPIDDLASHQVEMSALEPFANRERGIVEPLADARVCAGARPNDRNVAQLARSANPFPRWRGGARSGSGAVAIRRRPYRLRS